MYKINKIAFKITVLIFIVVICFYSFVNSYFYENETTKLIKVTKNITTKMIEEAVIERIEITEENKSIAKSHEWKLKIDAINLSAPIAQGTGKEVLNKYIGHFENTKKAKGNIGLAAHNRGYKVNYFKDIKKLKKGDIIQYFYNGKEYKYKVYKNYIIKDTDWSVLETKNREEITLITCVENRPAYRRCIKGIKIN